ncbi:MULTISPECIES: response regulator transcription factor [Polaribacter]|jgi:DNA-binding NarL/FixJ family response regulator|uniref:DNA-binding response regulator n=1 Tax=Polaribacter sejongensis TaxID=985043 RepID=A0AAJ1VGV4_9FLAO|nr:MULTISPECIES: response regulator transcription factor [Polaribacter]AUC20983.1 DNA-binding response regulator [Polaribacter sejongensis]MDN3619679.1 response regulator transcription factor [Polaribacter undariae]QXP64384.1 response regulator transcription factor [Polaribacter sp. HaHaR_3_91]QXP66873.1 response regulator transcription factor [Polaribacter sp. AHE13PA]QXP68986.1 response regulator transcription factor [Polaribacter sp. R2A056_3_33]
MKEKIYVHVADDHKILIEGIIAVINTDKEIEIKGYSLTGQEVIDWFDQKENSADVLILDITMPVLDGFEVLKHFRKRKIDQKVIILSSYDDLKIVQEVLSLGSNGYISKNNAGEHIVNAIKAVAKGEQYFSDDIQKMLLQSLSGQMVPKGEVPDKYLLESLTERELDVLKLITKEYSTIEMADLMHLSRNTIETYRKSLLKKLKVKNAVGLAMYAVKNNIV